MSYFDFGTIFWGIMMLFLGGIASALLYTLLKMCLLLRSELFSLVFRIFKNRFRLCAFHIKRLKKAPKVSRFGSSFLDFFSVICLFFFYLLISYAAFDGVYRLIFSIPLVAGFFFLCRFIAPWIEKYLFFIIEVILSTAETLISVPIFFISNTFRVLKRPISYIMYSLRQQWIRICCAKRGAVFLRRLDTDIKNIF